MLTVPPAGPDPAGTTATPGALVVLGLDPAAVPGTTEAAVRWFLTYSFSR